MGQYASNKWGCPPSLGEDCDDRDTTSDGNEFDSVSSVERREREEIGDGIWKRLKKSDRDEKMRSKVDDLHEYFLGERKDMEKLRRELELYRAERQKLVLEIEKVRAENKALKNEVSREYSYQTLIERMRNNIGLHLEEIEKHQRMEKEVKQYDKELNFVFQQKSKWRKDIKKIKFILEKSSELVKFYDTYLSEITGNKLIDFSVYLHTHVNSSTQKQFESKLAEFRSILLTNEKRMTAVRMQVRSEDDTLCIICCEAKREATLQCGHLFMCIECTERIKEADEWEQRRCPICRDPIVSYQKTYL